MIIMRYSDCDKLPDHVEPLASLGHRVDLKKAAHPSLLHLWKQIDRAQLSSPVPKPKPPKPSPNPVKPSQISSNVVLLVTDISSARPRSYIFQP